MFSHPLQTMPRDVERVQGIRHHNGRRRKLIVHVRLDVRRVILTGPGDNAI